MFETSFDIAAQDGAPTGFVFSNDGTRLFVTGAGADEINQYSLEIPFDFSNVDSVTFDGLFSVASEENVPQGIAFSNDGLTLFINGSGNDEINQYSLTDAFDITSGVSFDGLQSVATEAVNSTGLTFNADGTRLFVIGNTGDSIDCLLYTSPSPRD